MKQADEKKNNTHFKLPSNVGIRHISTRGLMVNKVIRMKGKLFFIFFVF